MSADGVVPPVTGEMVDRVLALLPALRALERYGEWRAPAGAFPYLVEDDAVVALRGALGPLLVVFDWRAWEAEAERHMREPEALATADLLTLRRLLTLHVRMDRFVGGHLVNLLESGHLFAILDRLAEVRRTMHMKES